MTGIDKDASPKIFRDPVRTFENAGVVIPEDSYFVPLGNVTNRNRQDIRTMVDRSRYFSIFAPRQSGKTTFFEETARQLHKDSTYVAIILTFQNYHTLDGERFYSLIQKDLYNQLISRLKQVDCEKIEAIQAFLETHNLCDHVSFQSLFEKLNELIQYKKIVIFVDEFDGIPLGELESFLNTLRALYQKYKSVKPKALYSVGLVGIRNVTKLVVGGVSPFNIADQVSLPPFSLENVRDLYGQYTAETNQPFTKAALRKIHGETAGQPWLVNRLGAILTLDVKPETVEPVDENDVQLAIDILVNENNDHFDNLYEKAKLYKETFVQIVFDHVKYKASHEDQSWLEQYGLIKNSGGHAIVANNIYKARFIDAFFQEERIPAPGDISMAAYLLPGGELDIPRIFVDFNRYIAQIGVNAFYLKKKPYEKTGQFLLTAWLYQFVGDGGGELRYEANSGLGRMDILLTHKGKKYIVETKVNRYKDITVITDEGINQLSRYMTTEDVEDGYLVIFDTLTVAGAPCKTQVHEPDGPGKDLTVTSFTIGIGQPEK